MQLERIINPFAPPAYNGVVEATPEGFHDVDFKVPFDVTLTANQEAPNLSQIVPTDADFIWRATVGNFQTANYAVRFADSQGYFFSNGRVHLINLSVSPLAPSVNGKEIVIPAGGEIGIDILNLFGGENVIQILFLGVKRYKIGK